MNFYKYGFDELRQCFPQFNVVYIFLEYFFQNISQMMLPVFQYKTKQLKGNAMNAIDEHN